MKRLLFIVCLWLSVLPIAAQVNDVPISAGTDFYFTVFDHTLPEETELNVIIQAVSTTNTRMTIRIGGKQNGVWDVGFTSFVGSIYVKPMEVVHITTSQPSYISAFIRNGWSVASSGAETAIIPAHLLGTSYMLQGVPGSLIKISGVPTQTYSQFSVVGTANNTMVTIQTPVDLTCVTTGQTISAGSKMRFSLSYEQALLFQPVDYTQSISGVQVYSNQPVAVFQGNNQTRIPSDEDGADYTWEQARPTTNWGTEFIVPKSFMFQSNIIQVTALDDNTELYWWTNGTKEHVKTLQAGETYSRTISTRDFPRPTAEHIQTSKPACCYVYFTGHDLNANWGDPAMVEIAPMDKPSTDTRWIMSNPKGLSGNTTYKIQLLVTMRADNQDNVLINNYPANTYNLASVTTDEYITYEMAYSAVQVMRIQALQGGFSAYTMHVGDISEASAFNVALPEIPSPPELCQDGQLVYLKRPYDFWSWYTDTVSGLCPGSNLSFSALVSYSRNEAIRVFVKDPTTNRELAFYERSFEEEGPETIYYNGRKWHRIGLNYTVQEGMSDLIFGVSNGYNALIDSFEVRLCVPPVTIIAPDTVCVDTKNMFIAEFENDGSFAEPLQYQWYFSADSITWTPLDEGHQKQLKLKAKPRHTGWYKVAVAGSGNINNEKCRAVSEPHKFFVIEECPPILCPEGILLFREDFGGNDPNDPRVSQTPVPSMTYNQLMTDEWPSMQTGSYIITKSGYCNGDTTQANQPQNRRSQWHLQGDHTYPNDMTRGYFMEVDGKGDNAAFYSLMIDGLCSGSDLSFVAYVANVMTWVQYENTPGRYAYPRLLFRLTDPTNNAELGVYDTGEIPFDSTFLNDYSCWQQSSEWHQVGMNFTVPDGLSSVKLTIYNNSRGSTGNDFAIDDIEVRLCMEPISISSANPACRKKSHTFYGAYENWGTLDSPEFMWTYSADSLTWKELQRGENKNYTIPVVHRSHEGWYKVTVANAGNLDWINCREESEPFKLETMYCNTAVDQYIDTTACDTLLEYDLHWRGHLWKEVGTVVDTIKDFEDDDSVYVHLTLQTKICCPDIERIRIDSAVCDTLMPFLWFFKDTMLLFDVPAAKEVEYQHPRWENCIGTIYTLALDTFHCERLYLLIHNKYNWQLVCNNVELARLFPELRPLEFQWFRDSVEIEGANSDDYSEEHELHGYYQLRIKLNEVVDNDDEYIWSNILDIHDTPEPAPVTKRIYNSSGMLVGEDRMTRGVYLILYQQGDKFWTEKKYIK